MSNIINNCVDATSDTVAHAMYSTIDLAVDQTVFMFNTAIYTWYFGVASAQRRPVTDMLNKTFAQ